MSKNQKSKGKKSYTQFYGSILGFCLTVLLVIGSGGYLIKLYTEMVSGMNDYLWMQSQPNNFEGKSSFFNITSGGINHLAVSFEFKAFDYLFFSKHKFNISLEPDLPITPNRFITVDIDKILPYIRPIGIMETYYIDGTLDRKMVDFQNCEGEALRGRLCPNWKGANMEN
jgi:hypothetical protein